jgi:hypothetical protein
MQRIAGPHDDGALCLLAPESIALVLLVVNDVDYRARAASAASTLLSGAANNTLAALSTIKLDGG